jgi:chlorobactene glucosyltransferase
VPKPVVRLFRSLAVAAAAAFAVRSIRVALGSNERIDACEPAPDMPMLSIIVPARNEERQIAECVESLLAQRYPHFEVIAVNDRSDDRTGAILAEISARDPRLTVIHGEALPPGWIGKPWAIAQGARIARGEWLIFTDADTTHAPLAAASAIRYARDACAQAVSLLPVQRFESAAERVVLPSILWMIAFSVGSLDAINDRKRTDAAIFNGQYIAFLRSAYDAIGGHAAVKNAIAEDYELARLLKRDGRFITRLAGANGLVQTRMYRSFAEIWHGFGKNLYAGAQNEPLKVFLGALWLGALSPLPELLLLRALLRRRTRGVMRMLAVIAATSAAAEFGMRRSHFPRGSGLFFPIGTATMLGIFLNSALRHRAGRVVWRGRTYGATIRRRSGSAASQT